jgi:hypothetical protein
MNIKHYPMFPIDKIEKHYSDKDGVPVWYVCTTELYVDDQPLDIYYRATPHPEFGNKYFGLRYDNDNLLICNADKVEGIYFGMVINDDTELEYSSYRHDFKKFKNGNMIDGGRAYTKSSCKVYTYYIESGYWWKLTKGVKL